LWTFPKFLRNIKADGVDRSVVIRLTRFHEINTIRIFFRFLFVLPLLILGIDGITPHEHINSNYFWTDLLAMLSAVGCCVSSGMTLVIFFPRSAESELEAKEAFIQSANANDGFAGGSRGAMGGAEFQMTNVDDADNVTLAGKEDYVRKGGYGGSGSSILEHPRSQLMAFSDSVGVEDSVSQRGGVAGYGSYNKEQPPRPSKIAWGRAAAVETIAEDGSMRLTAANIELHNKRQSQYGHHVHNFTSPINLIDRPVPRREQV